MHERAGSSPLRLDRGAIRRYPVAARECVTGTPEGVGALQPGDRIEGRIDGVGTIALTVGRPE